VQSISESLKIGILSTYSPTLDGPATFSAALADGLSAHGVDVSVVRVSDGPPSSSARVIGELVSGSAASAARCAELLNQSDVAVIQYDYSIDGDGDGDGGDEVVRVLDGLRVPSIVVIHSVLNNPTPQQLSVVRALGERADQVVVMSEAATERLVRVCGVTRHTVVTIPHGGTVPTTGFRVRGGRPVLLTPGLLRPGKGVERVIEAMGAIHGLPGRPRYVVAGPTHPKVMAVEGEAYRDARIEQAQLGGVAGSVSFEPGYHNVAMLSALVQSAAVVVLPYDSTDQVTSSALVDAVASGRPVVATAFPHAVELLASGAGIVVAHDDPDALVSALRRVLTEPRLAGTMAAEARRLAPELAWPIVAGEYLRLARRILAMKNPRGQIRTAPGVFGPSP